MKILSRFRATILRQPHWNHLGAIARDGNILIKNPKEIKSPDYYMDDEVYFIEKTSGKNAFGMPVPVRVFTTEAPSEVKKVKNKIAQISKKIEKLQKEYETLYAKQKEDYFNKIKDSPQELMKYGSSLKSKGELQDAYRVYKRILELAPDNIDARMSLADVYTEKKNLDLAIEEYKQVLSNNPQHVEANKKLGLILYDLKRNYINAVKPLRTYLEFAQESDPDYDRIKRIVDKIAYLDESYKKDIETKRYYEELEREVSNLRTSIEKWRDEINLQKGKLEEAKMGGYYGSSEDMWREEFILRKKQEIEIAQQRLRKIEAELASRGSSISSTAK